MVQRPFCDFGTDFVSPPAHGEEIESTKWETGKDFGFGHGWCRHAPLEGGDSESDLNLDSHTPYV